MRLSPKRNTGSVLRTMQSDVAESVVDIGGLSPGVKKLERRIYVVNGCIRSRNRKQQLTSLGHRSSTRDLDDSNMVTFPLWSRKKCK
jgi:hypothetical protein